MVHFSRRKAERPVRNRKSIIEYGIEENSVFAHKGGRKKWGVGLDPELKFKLP